MCLAVNSHDEESTIPPSPGQPIPAETESKKEDLLPDDDQGIAVTTTESTTTPSSPSLALGKGGDGHGSGGKIGCHDLRLAGETENKVYSLTSGKELNEGGRDYNTRYCDMTTDGGGWTVIRLNIYFIKFIIDWRRGHVAV